MENPSSDRLEGDIPFPAIKDVWELLTQTFKVYGGNIQWVLLLTVFFVPFLLAKNLIYASSPPDSKLIKFWIDSVVMGLVMLFTAPTLAYILARTLRDGSSPTPGEALGWGFRCFPRNFGYHFLSGLLTIGGFILLVVPGILVAIWYSMLSVVVSLEGGGQPDPLGRSKSLAKNHMGILFAGGLLLMVFNFIGCCVFGLLAGVGLGILKVLQHDTSPFVMTEHWLMCTVIEVLSVILGMDLGVMALCGYLSWSKQNAESQPALAEAPARLPAPPVAPTPLPASRIFPTGAPAAPARKTARAKRALAVKKAPRNRMRPAGRAKKKPR
jgi:hypothetical protein